MDGNVGLFQKTTLDRAKEQHQDQQTRYGNGNGNGNVVSGEHPTIESGMKRSLSLAFPQDSMQFNVPEQHPTVRRSAPIFRDAPKRLAPSPIISHEAGAGVVGDGLSDYSQRRSFAATPSSSIDPLLSLSHPEFALPPTLVQNFSRLGINTIYPWQKNCLLGPGLLTGHKNLIYCAPTGGGKSLVADVLMLKTIVKDSKAKALLVLPYVALVQEKVRWLRSVVQGLMRLEGDTPPVPDERRTWKRRADEGTIRVIGLFGGSRARATWADFDIGVCTIEKANALINGAIEDGVVGELRSVVLDELHMIDDDHRGYLLELLASKLLTLEQGVQIIGMSATMSNMHLLAQWLNAHAYETKYRPIPIEEHLVYEGNIYPASSVTLLQKAANEESSTDCPSTDGVQPTRSIKPSEHKEFRDVVLNAVVSLACETAVAGYGALVFTSSRGGCEADARWISRAMPGPQTGDTATVGNRLELIQNLAALETGLDPVLAETVPCGVAFHRLTTEERELIAQAYDAGVLKVCVATCSLAAGINLPARRVILHSARMGRDFVGPAMLRQMRGRAGRKGKDEVGETYLCCRKAELDQVVDLMQASLPEVTSSLDTDKHRMKRALLEVIAIRLASNRHSINEYVSKSLFYQLKGRAETEICARSSLQQLETLGLVTVNDDDEYSVTQLGKAVVGSALDPEDGLFIYRELKKALRAFVMDGDMHMLYTFTPVNANEIPINWKVFLNEAESLDESGQRVFHLVGLKMPLLVRLSQGATLKEETASEKELARIYRRFYVALQLRDLCNEQPVHVIARKYDTPRGSVQTLVQTSQGFAAGMVKFCQVMGWSVLAAALDHLSDRLKAGAQGDLLALAKLPFVKSRTARVFWDNGFRSVAAVANATAEELMPVLMQAQPNKIRLKGQDDSKYEEKLWVKTKMILDSANRLWQLELEAESFEEE